MKYSVKISPVSVSNQARVTIHLRRVLGQGAGNTIQSLVRNGGIVHDNLTKAEADRIASQLRNLGAVVEVSKTTSGEPEIGYRLKLTSAGDKKIAVIKEVRKITGLGLKEAKELVDGLGIIKEDLSRSAAKKIQDELASAGAKSKILPRSIPEPEPEPIPVEPEPTPADPPESDGFIVFGKILNANKLPVEGCTVRAFDRELRSEQLLGETRTDSKGSYKITYTKKQFKRAEKGAADLVVRAFNPVGTMLVMSDILFDASPEERIDLIVEKSAPVQPSVYERLAAVLTPLLDGVTFSDLTSDDIWFLADKTGCTIEEIVFLAEDARLSQSTEIPEAVFFGLVINNIGVLEPVIGQRLPVIELATVLDESVEHLLEVITQAIERNSVPRVLRNQLWKIRSQFESLKLSHNVESTPKRIERFKKLGRIAGLDDNVSKRISYRIVGNTPTNEEFNELVDQGVINASELPKLRLTFHLAELTNLDIKLVETLRFHLIPRISGHVTSPRDLAALDESDWLSVLEDYAIVPPEDQDKEDYARQIA